MAGSETQLLYADPKETFPEDLLHLSDASLLITADSSAPASTVLGEQRFYFSSSGLLLITANSSAPADQTPRLVHTEGLVEPSFLPKLYKPGVPASALLSILMFDGISLDSLASHV